MALKCRPAALHANIDNTLRMCFFFFFSRLHGVFAFPCVFVLSPLNILMLLAQTILISFLLWEVSNITSKTPPFMCLREEKERKGEV